MNGRIQGYVSKSGLNIGDSLRSQWGFGDDVATEQLSSILGGSTVLDVGGIEGVAQTVLNEQGQRVVSLSGYREGMSTGPHLHYQLMGDLGGTSADSSNWNMYSDRRNQFLDAFGSTGSMYAGGGYMNYYYDINNLKERLAIR